MPRLSRVRDGVPVRRALRRAARADARGDRGARPAARPREARRALRPHEDRPSPAAPARAHVPARARAALAPRCARAPASPAPPARDARAPAESSAGARAAPAAPRDTRAGQAPRPRRPARGLPHAGDVRGDQCGHRARPHARGLRCARARGAALLRRTPGPRRRRATSRALSRARTSQPSASRTWTR